MLRVNVSFPSGSGDTLLLPEHSKVGDLKILAQNTFRKGFLRLITVGGHVLSNPEDSLQAAGVQDGEHLTAVVQQPQVATSRTAFALWCCGCNGVVTWGHPRHGGNSSAVQDQLRNVQQIRGTKGGAFAAILADESVVAWGHPDFGGDCSENQDELNNVKQIQATHRAFAAILGDGSVVCWGHPNFGGRCCAVQHQLRTVKQI